MTRPLMKLITRVEATAPQNSISTLGTRKIESAIMAILTKIVNRPKDKIIKGRAKAVAIGFTIELTSEKISPAEA